jgi:hypothetical protein
VKLVQAALIGCDTGAFDPNFEFLDRKGGINGDLVVGGLPWAVHLTPPQRAARAAFSVALGRIAADVLA